MLLHKRTATFLPCLRRYPTTNEVIWSVALFSHGSERRLHVLRELWKKQKNSATQKLPVFQLQRRNFSWSEEVQANRQLVEAVKLLPGRSAS